MPETTLPAPSESAPAAIAPEAHPSGVEPTPSATPTPVEAPKEKHGAAFAALAKKERANREAAEKLKAERSAFEKQQAEYQAFQEAKANAKRFPLKLMASYGLSYQDLAEAQLNDGQPTANLEVKAVREEVEALRRERDEERQRVIEEQKRVAGQEFQATIDQVKSDVARFINANADKYELTKLYGQESTVYEVLEAFIVKQQDDGVPEERLKILSYEEAAEQVEKYLEDEASKLLASKKLQAKVKPPEVSPQAAPKRSTDQKPRSTTSITNQLSSSASATSPKALTAKEREQRAMALLAL